MTIYDTVTYRLRDGNEIVYIGTTNDPVRRLQEHQSEGKQFTKLEVTSRKMTEKGAEEKEAGDLAQYRKNHGGRNPKYNKKNDG